MEISIDFIGNIVAENICILYSVKALSWLNTYKLAVEAIEGLR